MLRVVLQSYSRSCWCRCVTTSGHAFRLPSVTSVTSSSGGLLLARFHAAFTTRLPKEKIHSSWLSRWMPAGRISLFTVPSGLAVGMLYWSVMEEKQVSCLAGPQPHQILRAELRGQSAFVGFCSSAYHTWQLLCRAAYLALLFTPVCLLAPFANLDPRIRRLWHRVLHATMSSSGPAFVKWAQWAATRLDLLPADTCAVLETLQTAAPQHSFEVTRQTVEQALGLQLEELFVEFSDAPIGSGAIAQVHKAKLSALGAKLTGQRAGQEVAVKVRHPGVAHLLELDFDIMVGVATLASHIPGLRSFRLDDSMRQFGAPLHQQLDLSIEAEHLERFRHNFRLWTRVRFPRPLWPLVQEDVLVESFEPGDVVSHYVRSATPFNPRIADVGLRTYLQMILKDNFIHADLHQGNVLVLVGDDKHGLRRLSKWLNPLVRPVSGIDLTERCTSVQLSLLDVGMTTELRKDHQQALIRLYQGISHMDGPVIAEAILRLRHMESTAKADLGSMRRDIEELFSGMCLEAFRQDTQKIVAEVMECLRRHRVTMDAGPSTVLITTCVLEGWSTKLNPDIRIMDTICEILPQTWMERIPRTVDHMMSDGALDYS